MLILAVTLHVLWPAVYVCMYVCSTNSAVLLKIHIISFSNICVISLLNYTM